MGALHRALVTHPLRRPQPGRGQWCPSYLWHFATNPRVLLVAGKEAMDARVLSGVLLMDGSVQGWEKQGEQRHIHKQLEL